MRSGKRIEKHAMNAAFPCVRPALASQDQGDLTTFSLHWIGPRSRDLNLRPVNSWVAGTPHRKIGDGQNLRRESS